MMQVHISMVCYVGVRHGLVQLKFILNKENKSAREWLRTTGYKNIDDLNKVLKTTATSWKAK